MTNSTIPPFAYTVKAHPTLYAGVQFRSRLEATWAAFFDIMRWGWEYEPIDLNGWVPDFRLRADGSVYLVEIKPHDFDRLVADRMRKAVLDGPILLISDAPKYFYPSDMNNDKMYSVGRESYNANDLDWDSWVPSQLPGEIEKAWATAGNITRWKGPHA